MTPDLPTPDLRDLERRLDRLQALAETRHKDLLACRSRLAEVRAFLDLAPKAAETLEQLTTDLFGQVLDEVEANLTHAVREILGQDRRVATLREVKNNRLHIDFLILQDEHPEDVLHGQGGSVCNILSTGLRLIALSQLDPAKHRPFLVLDEQDCWLKPELVPKFMRLVHQIALRLNIQTLVISHHPLDLFAGHADSVLTLSPSKTHGALVERMK